MTLLGLELSDAGIMVAGGSPPRLLAVDEGEHESPGYAIPEKKKLLVGRSAQGKAHLFPIQVNNKFWDQLSAEPLEQKNRHAQNHAEIACAHLSHVWDSVKTYGEEVIVAVPDYYDREHLGLILGMTQELSIPVKGFVSLAIAASSNPRPGAALLHLDIHLHRFEVTYLRQGKDLTRGHALAVQEISLENLYRTWVESIAEEFVRTTRFDPLHKASTEQALYDRLSDALEIFKINSSFIFELSQGKHIYRITLFRDLLEQKSATAYDEIRHLIKKIRVEHAAKETPVVLQLSHRVASLPGLKEKLLKTGDCEIVELESGTGAKGVLRLGDQLADGHPGHGVSFFSTRPWHQDEEQVSQAASHETPGELRPTHLLYRDVAYALSEKPLVVGSDDVPDRKNVDVQIKTTGVSKKHCTVQMHTGTIFLTDYSDQGTFVDDQRVDGTIILNLGQIIRLGTSGETIRLIVCKDVNET